MEKKINIVVLDFATVSVSYYTLNKTVHQEIHEDSEAVEEFITSEGHHLSNCHFMFSDNEITISDERI